ncbi:MAG TPA: hypothetical protein VGZ25_03450, partial [Gemmataceae bacterium]|nr:hypothetical protein [Gemmataceae bacterium]
RRDIMRALIKHVEVGEDGVRVVYKVQPCPFESGPQGGRSQHCWDGTHWHTGVNDKKKWTECVAPSCRAVWPCGPSDDPLDPHHLANRVRGLLRSLSAHVIMPISYPSLPLINRCIHRANEFAP